MEGTYGILSLLPVFVVIVTAIITKRAVEPLILGTLVGYAIIAKEGFIVAYLDSLYTELGESAYYVVIFGLFGIFIHMLDKANAVSGFTKTGPEICQHKKESRFSDLDYGNHIFLGQLFQCVGCGRLKQSDC